MPLPLARAPFLPAEQPALSARTAWAANRLEMETANLKSRRYGGRSHHHWYALLYAMRAFELALKGVGLYERGRRHAEDLRVRELDVPLAGLPRAFDGFTVLHLSDLHLDGMPGLEHRIAAAVAGRAFDLCVLTGDYRTELHGPIEPPMAALERLVGALDSRRGFLAVLGNHDDAAMVPRMESMGIRVLVNERVFVEAGGDRIQVIGTDDPHYYYTEAAREVLERAREELTIGLIHTPELYDTAAALGVDLYLCGHTHGGQVCLPGGAPVVTHLSRGRQYVRGVWRHRGMTGITNQGAGTSGIPVRFNTRGELLALTLRTTD